MIEAIIDVCDATIPSEFWSIILISRKYSVVMILYFLFGQMAESFGVMAAKNVKSDILLQLKNLPLNII